MTSQHNYCPTYANRIVPRAGKTTLSLLKHAESSVEMLPIFNQGKKQ